MFLPRDQTDLQGVKTGARVKTQVLHKATVHNIPAIENYQCKTTPPWKESYATTTGKVTVVNRAAVQCQ